MPGAITLFVTLLLAAPPANADTPVAQEVASALPAQGVTDANDGWVHVLTIDHAVVRGAVVESVAPDLGGDVDVHVQVWTLGAPGVLPSRLEIANASLFPVHALEFANATGCPGGCVPFLTVDGAQATPSADGRELVFQVPYAEIAAAQASGSDTPAPFVVQHDAWYLPASGGAAPRSDHPENTSLPGCAAGCYQSSGSLNAVKNGLLLAGFAPKDGTAEGGDASGTAYGAGDQLAAAAGSPALGYKARVDQLDPLAAVVDAKLATSDVTDDGATLVWLDGQDPLREPSSAGADAFLVQVVRFDGAGPVPVPLAAGTPVALRLVTNATDGIGGYACGAGAGTVRSGFVSVCGRVGAPGFALLPGGVLRVSVPSASIGAAGLAGQPVALSAWVGDSSFGVQDGLLGAYSPGNGWYSVPKLVAAAAGSPVASALDWAFTPFLVGTTPDAVQAVSVVSPTNGSIFPPNATVPVTWLSPINDFLATSEFYAVDVVNSTGATLSETTSYQCTTNATHVTTCFTDATTPPGDGAYTIVVRTTLTTLEAQLGQPLPTCVPAYLGLVSTCDNSTVLVDTTPPTVNLVTDPARAPASGWFTSNVSVSMTCVDDLSGCASESYRIGNGP
jgi:hypothetical protein